MLTRKCKIQRPTEHLADCMSCKKPLIYAGNKRQYLRCRECKYLVLIQGVIKSHVRYGPLASCLACRKRMHHRGGDTRPQVVCAHCGASAMRAYATPPPVTARYRERFIETLIPLGFGPYLRHEVFVDLMILVIETRRARRVTKQQVKQVISDAKRRMVFGRENVSIYEGAYPLIERL